MNDLKLFGLVGVLAGTVALVTLPDDENKIDIKEERPKIKEYAYFRPEDELPNYQPQNRELYIPRNYKPESETVYDMLPPKPMARMLSYFGTGKRKAKAF